MGMASRNASRMRRTTPLSIEEGSLYPALQRLLRKGWVTAKWGITGLNRRARFYTLTRDGRKQLGIEMTDSGA